MVEIYDLNCRLISMGFQYPELFAILADPKADPVLERRYLQLFVNLFSLLFAYVRASVFDKDYQDNLMRDLKDFFNNRNVRRYWEQFGSFYAVSFQELVNGVIKEVERREPPPTAAAAPLLTQADKT